MGFKRTVLIIAAITFLIMMLMMALVIKNSYKSKMYPAVVSKCPDYWILKDDECKPDPEIEMLRIKRPCRSSDIQYSLNVKGTKAGKVGITFKLNFDSKRRTLSKTTTRF